MEKNPAFKSHLQVEVLNGEGVLILSEEKDSARAFTGELFEKVASFADGTRTADDIAYLLSDQMPPAHVYYALQLLEDKGYFSRKTDAVPASAAAYWDGLGADPETAHLNLASKTVRVISVGSANSKQMISGLANAGIELTQDSNADLDIIITDDYLRQELLNLFRQSRLQKRPCLIVKATGFQPWIGPLFADDNTGCFACLVSRLARNRTLNLFVAAKKGLDEPVPISKASLASTEAMAVQIAAVEAGKFLATGKSSLIERVLSIDVRNWSSRLHPWIANPCCKFCANEPRAEALPLKLVSCRASFVKDGGHRVCRPEDTLAKYAHLVSPISGIVPDLVQTEGAANSGFVVMAGLNSTLKLQSLDALQRGFRNICSGKGATATQAKASALCEALERYSFEFMGDEIRKTASLNELGSQAIHPNQVLLYSMRQFQERESWNSRKSKFNWVPEQFDPDEAVDWTPVWSLSQECHKYLPTQLLYFGAKAKEGSKKQFARACSNGNAAGNTIEEALLQGFFELVERDAMCIWWYNRLSMPGVDIASFGDSYLNDFLDSYARLGRQVWALDLTSDLGIPVFVALSRQQEGQERIMIGMGCHFDAGIALRRAIGEMNQMYAVAYGVTENSGRIEDPETISWLKTATIENQPYLVSSKKLPARKLADYAKVPSEDLLDNILASKSIVEKLGLEMLVLDQTRADIKMPVIKVIVPGLRHYWARFEKGRLYDVPVKMGWLEKPLTEDELNPIAVFV